MSPISPHLAITFATLRNSVSAEVAGVLRRAAGSRIAEIRRNSIETLLVRDDESCHLVVAKLWPDLANEIAALIQETPSRRDLGFWIRTLQQKIAAVQSVSDPLIRWIEIAQRTNAFEAIPALMDRTESGVAEDLRSLLVDVTTQLVQSWSRSLHRRGGAIDFSHDRESLRKTVVERCVLESNRKNNFSDKMWCIDSALSLSRWSDEWLAFDNSASSMEMQSLVADRWVHSSTVGVMRMLASGIDQSTIHDDAWFAIESRTDHLFRDLLLEMISPRPSQHVITNLSSRRLPRSLSDDSDEISAANPVTVENQIASLHAVSAARGKRIQTIDTILEFRDDENAWVQSAVACSLARCVPPAVEVWIEATSGRRTRRVRLAKRVLDRLMDCSAKEESATARAAKRLLRSLDPRLVLPMMAELSETHRRDLGTILLRHDPSTLDVVRDGLRHPLVRRRMESIELVETLGLVDELIRPLQQIATNDHPIARVRVAEALGKANDPQSLEVLQEMSGALQASVAEAAHVALQTRLVVHTQVVPQTHTGGELVP